MRYIDVCLWYMYAHQVYAMSNSNTPLAAIMTENYSTLKNSLADFTFAYDDVRSFLFAVFLYLFTVISTRSLFSFFSAIALSPSLSLLCISAEAFYFTCLSLLSCFLSWLISCFSQAKKPATSCAPASPLARSLAYFFVKLFFFFFLAKRK